MANDDVLAVNATQMRARQRTPGGKTTSYAVTTTVTSEPLTFMLDEGAVAKKAAEALALQIREQTKGIAAPVKESTAKARAVQERAFSKGRTWALKRFSGGRTGVTPPQPGERRAFNHSGRLADGIVAAYVEKLKEFRINYPANRWNPKDWRSLGEMQLHFNRWVSLVPALKDPKSDLSVQRALVETHRELVQKQAMGTDHKRALAIGKAAVQALQIAQKVLGA